LHLSPLLSTEHPIQIHENSKAEVKSILHGIGCSFSLIVPPHCIRRYVWDDSGLHGSFQAVRSCSSTYELLNTEFDAGGVVTKHGGKSIPQPSKISSIGTVSSNRRKSTSLAHEATLAINVEHFTDEETTDEMNKVTPNGSSSPWVLGRLEWKLGQ
jgi:hypothetical protein